MLLYCAKHNPAPTSHLNGWRCRRLAEALACDGGFARTHRGL